MKTIYKGTLQQCWVHYASTLPVADKHVIESRQALVDFVGVRHGTVRVWMNAAHKPDKKVTLPIGEAVIRLRYFLELLGYEVKELKALDSTAYNVGLLCAFKVLSFEQVRGELVYTHTPTLYQVLHGTTHFVDDRLSMAKALCQKYAEELAAKRAEWEARLGLREQPVTLPETPQCGSQGSVSKAPASEVRVQPVHEVVSDTITVLSHLIRGAMPLADALSSDEFSAEDRRRLRELVGEKIFFDFYNSIGRLCSEAARTGNFRGSKVSQTLRP